MGLAYIILLVLSTEFSCAFLLDCTGLLQDLRQVTFCVLFLQLWH